MSFSNPSSLEVDIRDIARALSRIPRFTGHSRDPVPYSVAQHSILVSEQTIDSTLALHALLHDAHEAYTGDVVRPFKMEIALRVGIDIVSLISDEIQEQIYKALGIPLPSKAMASEIKEIDMRMLRTEMEQIHPHGDFEKTLPEAYVNFRIVPLHYEMAEKLFLERYRRLYGY